MKPVIIEQAPDSFYTYIVREVNNGRGDVETVCIRGYDARTFKTRKAAERSTAAYIAKVTGGESMNEQFLLPVCSDWGFKENNGKGNQQNKWMQRRVKRESVIIEIQESAAFIPSQFSLEFDVIEAKFKLSKVVQPKEAPYLHLLPVAGRNATSNTVMKVYAKLVYESYLTLDLDNKIWY